MSTSTASSSPVPHRALRTPARPRRPPAPRAVPIPVAVPVEQEIESRARTELEEVEPAPARARELQERRQEREAAPDLVRLHVLLGDEAREPVAVLRDGFVQLRPRVDPSDSAR